MDVRKFLERNKIFFETIAALLLSAMAVVVAMSQTSLLRLQTRIAEAQVLPQLRIGTFIDNDGALSWIVENTRAPVHNVETQAACFLAVSARTSATERKSVRFTVHDCIGSWFGSPVGTGELVRVNGSTKVPEVEFLVGQIAGAAAKLGWKETETKLQVIVRLRYVDLLKRSHETFYSTGPRMLSGQAMPTEEGIGLFRRSEHPSMRFNFAELPPERIVALVAKTANGAIVRRPE